MEESWEEVSYDSIKDQLLPITVSHRADVTGAAALHPLQMLKKNEVRDPSISRQNISSFI